MIRLQESRRRLDEHVQLLNQETRRWNLGESRPMTSDEYMVYLREGRDTRQENNNDQTSA
jgi:hypothetical protein